MIEKYGDGLRVTGPMLIANASALLDAGRFTLWGGGAFTFQLWADWLNK